MNVNDAFTAQWMSVAHYSLFYDSISFFRVEWEEKDFLGRLARREWRWINPNSFTCASLYPKIQDRCTFHNKFMNNIGFASAGRSWYPRKSWAHRRNSKKPWHCFFLFWMIILFSQATYPGNSFHSIIQCWVFAFQGLMGFIGPVGEAGLAGEKVRQMKQNRNERVALVYSVLNSLTKN